MTLIFASPPASKTGTAGSGGGHHNGRPVGEVGRWLDALREHPMEWAKFPRPISTNTAYRIRRGLYQNVAPGEFVAVARNFTLKRRADIYAMFVGESA